MEAPSSVVEWQPGWSRAFELIAIALVPAMPDGAVVEHVGSTAVVGLAAKPIIDVDLVVMSPDDVPEAVRRLEELGYVHRGDLGIRGREAFGPLPGFAVPPPVRRRGWQPAPSRSCRSP